MSNSATNLKVCCETDVSPRSVADRCWDSVNVDTLLPRGGHVKEIGKGSWSICSEYEALWGIRCLQQCHLARYGRRGRTLAVPTETSLSGHLSVPHPYPTQPRLGRRGSSCSVEFSANLLLWRANIMHLFYVHTWEVSFLSFFVLISLIYSRLGLNKAGMSFVPYFAWKWGKKKNEFLYSVYVFFNHSIHL